MTTLREEYEAKLRVKDEEIKTLKDSVHDLRESRRDKDDMIATTKEMNKSLLGQLQERKELSKAKEENMYLFRAEQKKEAEVRLQKKQAELQKELLEARKKTHREAREKGLLSERIKSDAQTIKDLKKNVEQLASEKRAGKDTGCKQQRDDSVGTRTGK
ncbi:hypothetical protein LZL87_007898 [Fusarium oxysporum]|nr:hypothetical protein LZL87_007898 [Fusarium oxysporum]